MSSYIKQFKIPINAMKNRANCINGTSQGDLGCAGMLCGECILSSSAAKYLGIGKYELNELFLKVVDELKEGGLII